MKSALHSSNRRRLLNAGYLFFAFLLVLAAHVPAESQITGANLSGVVSDQSGGTLPGVTVTVTNLDSGTQQVHVTETDGKFRAVALRPGRYEIVADLSGFTRQARQITLTVGAEATISFELGVGAVAEVVNVSGAAPLVEVVRSQPSSAVVGDQIATLPVLERNFLTLAQLLPSSAADQRPNRFATTKFGGAADQRNSFTTIIDGGDIDDVVQGNPTINMSQDAVQEFKVFRNQFDAQYGNALSAVVTVVSKSGTNNIDGSAYYFGRDSGLNAKNAFAKTKPEYKQFRGGGSIGGPIVANRTHFFGSYEYNDVNDFKIIALPATNPFATRENGTFPSGRTNHLALAKVDHQLNSKISMLVRYVYDNQFILRSGNPSSDSQQGDDYSRTHSLIAETTAIISNSLVNSLRVHFMTQNVGTLVHSHDPAIIRPSVSTGQPATWPQQFPRKHLWMSDTLYLTKSRHDLKFGGDFGFSTSTYESHANESGQFAFNTDLPFDPNVRATWPISLVIQSPGDFTFASNQLALYAQDNWRVADRVRLNLGLRYDYDTNLRSRKIYAALLANPAFAGIENFVKADRGNDVNNVQPRLGATWDVLGTGRLVARAGWGLYITRNRPYFQESDQAGTLTNAVRIEDPEKLRLFPDINAILGGKTPAELALAGGARSLALLSNDYVLPYQMTTTAGVGLQLWKNTSMDIDYVHAVGREQMGSMDHNLPASGAISASNPRPVRQFTVVKVWENNTSSWYDALEVQMRTRVRGTNSLQVSYTLSRTYLDGVTHYANYMGTMRTPHETGYSGQDTRHNLAIAMSTSLPWGIEASGIFKALSGAPFNVAAGYDMDGDGQTQGDRPAGLNITVGRSNVDEALAIINALRVSRKLTPVDASLFKLNPYVALDMRLTKSIAVGGNRQLQLFMEAYNLTNRVNYSSSTVNGNIISTSFLIRNGAADPRQLQWGLRFVF